MSTEPSRQLLAELHAERVAHGQVGDWMSGQIGNWTPGLSVEINGEFGSRLSARGFSVQYLGAAVLVEGPATVIDHMMLEVAIGDARLLADVAFPGLFVEPLDLNRSGPQTDPGGTFELIASPQGTTLAKHVDAVPSPQYRFKRVAHRRSDFDDLGRA